jgi:hypothetical protein
MKAVAADTALFRKRLIVLTKYFEVKPPRDPLSPFEDFFLVTLRLITFPLIYLTEIFNLEHKRWLDRQQNLQTNSSGSEELLAGLRGQKRLLITSHDRDGLSDEVGRKLQWFGQQPFSFLR